MNRSATKQSKSRQATAAVMVLALGAARREEWELVWVSEVQRAASEECLVLMRVNLLLAPGRVLGSEQEMLEQKSW